MGVSMQEFLLIAMVALVVIGPRELPGMMRTIARGLGMAQRAAREFYAELDRMARDGEIADLRRDIEGQETSGWAGPVGGRQEDGSKPWHARSAPRAQARAGSGPTGTPGG